MDDEEKPHGLVRMVDRQFVWEGMWRHGLMHGKCRFLNENYGAEFLTFVDGVETGPGWKVHKGRDQEFTFRGEFANGEPANGFTTFLDKKTVWEGACKWEKCRHTIYGFGKMTHADGTVYIGHAENGSKCD